MSYVCYLGLSSPSYEVVTTSVFSVMGTTAWNNHYKVPNSITTPWRQRLTTSLGGVVWSYLANGVLVGDKTGRTVGKGTQCSLCELLLLLLEFQKAATDNECTVKVVRATVTTSVCNNAPIDFLFQ